MPSMYTFVCYFAVVKVFVKETVAATTAVNNMIIPGHYYYYHFMTLCPGLPE